jgi:hypothetical protein
MKCEICHLEKSDVREREDPYTVGAADNVGVELRDLCDDCAQDREDTAELER